MSTIHPLRPHLAAPSHASAIRHVPAVRARLSELWGRFLHWHNAVQERREMVRLMQGMHDDMLRDIGLSRADVTREAMRPFWHGADMAELERTRRMAELGSRNR